MSAFTRGRVRYRIAWKPGGHRRSTVFDVASRVALIEPAFVNDPTRSTWELSVDDREGRLRVELSPKSLADPRFTYRVADVPAASHPTIAAAIVHVGGARNHDVVWDPFVGSGMELVERARMGPYESLFGTDTSESALVAAMQNFESAGGRTLEPGESPDPNGQRLERFSLEKSDALHARPSGVTLIVTNPPMGRRVTRGESLDTYHQVQVSERLFSLLDRSNDVQISVRCERAIHLLCPFQLRNIGIARLNVRTDFPGLVVECCQHNLTIRANRK